MGEPAKITGDASGQRSLDLQGLPAQMDFWGDCTDLAVLGLVGPLGTGKTRSLILKDLILHLANHAGTGRAFRTMLVEPTFGMVEDILIPGYEDVIQGEMGIPCEIVGGNRPEIRWPRWMTPPLDKFPGVGRVGQRAVTTLRSAEKPKRLAGPNLMAVGMDEPAQMDFEAFKRARPRARHPQAIIRQTFLTLTPEGLGWCADLLDDPQPPVRTIRAHEWHPSFAWYPGVLRDTFKGSDAELATYLGGRFVPLRSGRAYRSFSPVVIRRAEYVPGLPLILCCDFNIDAMRWEVIQLQRNVNRPGGRIIVLDEIALGSNGTVEHAAKRFIERWGPNGERATHGAGCIITGDASGNARSQTGQTCYRELKSVLRGQFRSISTRVPDGNPRVRDRVDTFNWHLRGAGGWDFWIDPSAIELRKDLERNVWITGRADIEQKRTPPDDQRTHAASAVGYMLVQLLPMRELRTTTAKTSRVKRRRIRNPGIDGGW